MEKNIKRLITRILLVFSSVVCAQQTSIKISDYQYSSSFGEERCEEYIRVIAHFTDGTSQRFINYTNGNATVADQEHLVNGIVERLVVNVYAKNRSGNGFFGCFIGDEIIQESYEIPIDISTCEQGAIDETNSYNNITQSFSFTYEAAPIIGVAIDGIYNLTADTVGYEELLTLTADDGLDQDAYQWQYSIDNINWVDVPLSTSQTLEFRLIDILDESIIDEEVFFRIGTCDGFSTSASASKNVTEYGLLTRIDITNYDYDYRFDDDRCDDEIRMTAYFSDGTSRRFIRHRNGGRGTRPDREFIVEGVVDYIDVYMYGKDAISLGIFGDACVGGSRGGRVQETHRINLDLNACDSGSFYERESDGNDFNGSNEVRLILSFDYKVTPLPKAYKDIVTNIIGYEDLLALNASEGFEDVVYDWQYSFLEVGQDLDWMDLPGVSAPVREIVLANFADVTDDFDESIIGRDISFRTHSCDGDGSQNVLNYTVRRSGPRIVDFSLTPVSCYDSEDGSITVTFDKPLLNGDVFGFAVADLDDPDNAVVANVNNVTEFGTDNEITITGLPPSTTEFLLEMVGGLNGEAYYTDADYHKVTFAIGRPTPVAFVDEPADSAVNVFCYGGEDGEITLTAEGGVGTYEYSIQTENTAWDDNDWLPFSEATTHTITNLPPDTYYIKIQDANGCIAKEQRIVNEEIELGIDIIKEIIITEPDAPLSVSTEILNQPTAYGFEDGRIVAVLQGGTPIDGDSYTFEWRNENNEIVSTVNTEYVTDQGYIITLHSIGEGAYTLTATDANYDAATDREGCTITTTTINLVQPPPIEIGVEVTPISCNVDNEYSNNIDTNFDGVADQFQDGVLVATVTGGIPFDSINPDYSMPVPTNANGDLLPYFYHWKMQLADGTWQDIDVNDTFIDFLDTSTQYSVNVTDKNGITLGDYVITLEADGSQSYVLQQAQDVEQYLSVPESLDLMFNNKNVSCANGNDGNAEVFVSGGVEPYSYEWSTGATTKTLDNLIAGIYRVFVTDANGCEVEGNILIEQSNNIEIQDVSVISPTCYQGNDGFIDSNVTGGVPPYTYSWSTGETTLLNQNLSAGEYILEITDNSGCKAFKAWTLIDPEPVVVNLESERSICNLQILDLDITIDDPNATYSWVSDNGFISFSATVSLIESGTYTATITNGLGCVGTSDIVVEVFDRDIDSYFLITTQAYADEEIILVNVSTPIGETMEWTLPDECQIISQTDEELTIKFAEEGSYEIHLRSYQGGCYEDFSKTIIVEPASDIPSEYYTTNNLIEEFIVYPNPNSGTFNTKITLSEEANISVKTMDIVTGAILDEREAGNNLDFLFDHSLSLPAGLYLMLLETPKESVIRKLIIE